MDSGLLWMDGRWIDNPGDGHCVAVHRCKRMLWKWWTVDGHIALEARIEGDEQNDMARLFSERLDIVRLAVPYVGGFLPK